MPPLLRSPLSCWGQPLPTIQKHSTTAQTHTLLKGSFNLRSIVSGASQNCALHLHKRIFISGARRSGWGTSKLRSIPIGTRSRFSLTLPSFTAIWRGFFFKVVFSSPPPELYQRALALDPKRYEIYNDLGVVLTDLGNFGAAIEAFRRSLRLNPRSAKTIASLGRLFECKGDLISAADAYRDAIKLDPQLHAAYGDLGFVLYGLGELAEASDCFHRLRALRPDSAEATVNLGFIHLLQGDLAAGWAEYESRWKVGVGDDRRLVQRRWKGRTARR